MVAVVVVAVVFVAVVFVAVGSTVVVGCGGFITRLSAL